MEEAYTVFADVYDEFMNNIPYEKWCDNIHKILSEKGICKGIIAELGCGTGKMTRLMAGKGYEMIGVDNSEDMLAVAREQEDDSGILYLLQDMRELELYGTVEAVISLCDSMNYLTDRCDIIEVLRKVNLYLERDGLFIFDMKSEYCYENVLADTVQFEDAGDCSLVWENHFDKESRLHTYDLTIFLGYEREEDNEPVYEKYKENHVQRAYSIEEVKEMIDEAGMELVAIRDADTCKEVSEKTERIMYIVKETYQNNKMYC